ncbi:uncharacterized protein LOC134286324 [Aedes albopictus]|uniref:CCHC-type domain-containing protein n=1 Tax=Aedes albopictus TaxID=7160 RepID=A0ABM1XQC4_AEDAL
MGLDHTPQSAAKSSKKKDKKVEREAAEVDEMKNLIHQRGQIKRKVTLINHVLEAAEDDVSEVSASLLKVYSKKVELHYQEYVEAHREVLAATPSSKLEEQDEIQMAFDVLHTEVLDRLERLSLLFVKSANPAHESGSPHVILQQQPLRAPIPSFDGKVENWPKFRTMFEDIVVSSHDSDALKLHHLDKALVGDAFGWITVKMLQDNNFQQTWKQLKEQFENPRVIVDMHLTGLLELETIVKRNSKDLLELVKTVNRHVGGLECQGINVDRMSGLLLTKIITARLDDETLQLWERTQEHGKLPDYEQTIKFLQGECQVLERFQNRYQSGPAKELISKPPNVKPCSSQKSHVATPSVKPMLCLLCGEAHRHFECPTINKWSLGQRIEKVKELNLCFNCLRSGHRSIACPSKKTCSKCQRRHHTLLHEEPKQIPEETDPPVRKEENVSDPQQAPSKMQTFQWSSSNTAVPNTQPPQHKTAMLMTAVVILRDLCNRKVPCRVLLDSGSQVSFISKAMADSLSVLRYPTLVPVTGIGAARTCAHERITVAVESRCSDFATMVECLVIPKVTEDIPTARLDISNWSIPADVFLADPEFNTPGQIDMLLGVTPFLHLLKSGRVQLRPDLPDLQETHLGWVVAGDVEDQQNEQQCFVATTATLSETMTRFWEVEEVSDVDQSTNQHVCERIFQATQSPNPDVFERLRSSLPKEKEILLRGPAEVPTESDFAEVIIPESAAPPAEEAAKREEQVTTVAFESPTCVSDNPSTSQEDFLVGNEPEKFVDSKTEDHKTPSSSKTPSGINPVANPFRIPFDPTCSPQQPIRSGNPWGK